MQDIQNVQNTRYIKSTNLHAAAPVAMDEPGRHVMYPVPRIRASVTASRAEYSGAEATGRRVSGGPRVAGGPGVLQVL